MISALKNDRKAIGAEKEPLYCAIAKERIQQYYGFTLPIRPIGKPIYQPTGNEKTAQIPEEWKGKVNENNKKIFPPER